MTKSKINKNYFFKNTYTILILCIISLIVAMPSIAIDSFYKGITIWAKNVLPSLLPFFILTKLLSFTPVLSTIGNFLSPITCKLYGVGGVSGYIYIMSIISGYPVGAKLTSDLHSRGDITSGQAITISAFTSTSGPLFIIGTIAIGFFKSLKLGIIILISHFIGALLNGLIYRKKGNSDVKIYNFQKHSQNILNESMKNSIESIFVIGGFIALFYMILQILIEVKAFTFLTYPLEFLGVNKSISLSIISGLIEITTGAMMLSSTTLNFKPIATILSFLVSFGGFSIHAQAYTFLKSFNMPYMNFFIQKLTHAIISCVFTILILCFI